MTTLSVGQLVVDKDNFRGTVRYVGPVASSKNAETIYAGIEWDDSTRGKNDGSATGADGVVVRYFTTKTGATTSASFLKPELLFTGVTIQNALHDRYNDDSSTADNSITGLSGKAVPITLVGDAQIRASQTLNKLTSASLRGCGVASIPRGSLTGLCVKLREVDLRGNLLSSWEGLAELGAALPSLRTLNLADNPLLGPLPADAASLTGCLPQLRTLIVSECRLDWPSVLLLDAIAPNVEELHVCKNGIATIVLHPAAVVLPSSSEQAVEVQTAPGGASFVPQGVFKKLKTLSISENPLSGWGQVYAFAFLPRLSWLLACDCGLSEVWCPPTPCTTVTALLEACEASEEARQAAVAHIPFAGLEQLSITGSSLGAPWTLDALDAFPSLTTLRLSNADLSPALVAAATLTAPPGGSGPALGPSEARQLIVARCPKIQMCNGSEVRLREREDAEKAYTKKVGAAWADKHGSAYGGGKTVQDLFSAQTASDDAVFKGLYSLPPTSASGTGASASASAAEGLPATTLNAPASAGFSKGADSGLIRAKPGIDKSNPYYTSPLPLWPVSYTGSDSGGASAPYLASLDPYGLGSTAPAAAGALQAVFPRYFMLAAKYDLHAPHVAASGALAAMTGASVTLTIRSMAGSSCMMEPAVRKLPVTTSVAALKQLAAKLFKVDPSLARLSVRDSSGSYPSLLEDDMKPLSYYAVSEGCEVLVEEVDPAEAARQAADTAAAKAAREAAQEAQGEALRRAQESSVTAQRRAAAVSSTGTGAAGKAQGKAVEDDRI